ncbi:MAG: FKBP-type peptidyl-prolyl cis-trans isomerase [Roseburia sp.]|nr:FKBP-type peptidyl-prolyl cis-trans isomerase [Roseburia sp.]
MKKKIMLLLLCLFCAFPAGCGGDSGEKSVDGTEVSKEAPGVKSTDIQYDVNDYVTLGDYMDVEVTIGDASEYEVTEDAVKEYAEQLIARYSPYMADDTKTEVGENDIVDVDYVGKKDGVAFDGGTAQNQFIDVANNCDAVQQSGYIEGFTDGLKGAKVGETVDSNVTFPENYGAEELAGQEVTFTFTVNAVVKPTTVEGMDDATAKKYYQVDTKEVFMEQVGTVLKMQLENVKQSAIRTQVIDVVTEKSQVKEFPKGLLEARVEEYMAGFERANCADGTSLEDFVKNNYGSTLEDFRKDVTENMEENIRQELVFEAIVEKEDIQFDEEEYNTYISNLVESGGYGDEDTLYETYGADRESGKIYMQKVYLQNKACQMIADKAKVNYGEKENS